MKTNLMNFKLNFNLLKNLIFSFALVISLSGCLSVKKISAPEYSPLAVISVTGNQTLPWYKEDYEKRDDDDDGTGVLSTMANKLLGGQNIEILSAVDRLDYAEDSLRAILSELGVVSVLDSETVVNSENYIKISEGFFNKILDSDTSSTKLKKLANIGSKNARLLMSEIGANSLLLANFQFSKRVVSGNKRNGVICGNGMMTVRIYDSKGSEVISLDFETDSVERIVVTKGNYDENALVDCFPGLIDNLITQFAMSQF